MSAVLEEVNTSEDIADSLEERAGVLWDSVDQYEAVRVVGTALGDLFVDAMLRRRNREQLVSMARFIDRENERLEV